MKKTNNDVCTFCEHGFKSKDSTAALADFAKVGKMDPCPLKSILGMETSMNN